MAELIPVTRIHRFVVERWEFSISNEAVSSIRKRSVRTFQRDYLQSCFLFAPLEIPQNKWDTVLPEAMAFIHGLLCTATNEKPHSKFFNFESRGTAGIFYLVGWPLGDQHI